MNFQQQGRNISAAGVLKKKTVDMLVTASATKQTLLEYFPHNYYGTSGATMMFWNNSTEMTKSINTSPNCSGLWNVNIGWSGFNLAQPGYAKLGNGMTIQWGSVIASTHMTDYKYFPVAFDNAALIGIACYGYIGASGTGSGFSIIDKFKFLVSHRADNTALVAGAVNWVAIGY